MSNIVGKCRECGSALVELDESKRILCCNEHCGTDQSTARAGVGCTALVGDDVAEALAKRFHETYERLAPSYGYETRKDSAVPWEKVPEKNKALMRAVCAELLAPTTSMSDREATTTKQ